MITEAHKKEYCYECVHAIPYVEYSLEAGSRFSCREGKEVSVACLLKQCEKFKKKNITEWLKALIKTQKRLLGLRISFSIVVEESLNIAKV